MKLWYSFVKELQLTSKSWYFYIEFGMAIILLMVIMFAIPEETNFQTDEYIYAADLPSDYIELIYRNILDEEDERVGYEQVEITVGKEVYGADLFVADNRNIYFVDSREAVIKLAEDEKEVGIEIIQGKDGGIEYIYYLQGYESWRLKNLYMLLNNNINYKLIDRQMDSQNVKIIDENSVILNNRENVVPVYLTFNGSLMGLFIIAAFIFLDKKEGIIKAYAVTASKVWHYLMSKVGVLMLTTTVTSLIVVVPVMGMQVDYLSMLLLLFVTAFAFSSLGLVITTYYRDMMQSFGVLYILIMGMIIPNISYYVPSWEPAWMKWIPTYHMLESYKDVVSGVSDPVYVLQVATGFFVAGVVLFMFANYRFKKTLMR
jgi:hypothetical protein